VAQSLCGCKVLYQLADVNDQLGERQKAIEWFIQLLSVVPTDAGVLRRLGHLCDADGDPGQAFHYYTDSHRYDPNNIAVIEWLGKYYIESQLAEKVGVTLNRLMHRTVGLTGYMGPLTLTLLLVR